MLYKWSIQNCPNVQYVLKADDDSFVDTFHLPRFLERHKFSEISNFLLCFVVRGNFPQRNVSDKWYVTRDEYRGEKYPPYCSGSVYVTKIKTMKKILSKVKDIKYLFIDDLFVTGIAAKAITAHYDWSESFLESHMDSANDIMSPKTSFYTPQLLAAMNLNSTSILHMYKKSQKCHDNPKCYNLLNQLPADRMRPIKVTTNYRSKSEL